LTAQAVAIARDEVRRSATFESRFDVAAAELLRGEVAQAMGNRPLAARAYGAALVAIPEGAEVNPERLVQRLLILEGLGRSKDAATVAHRLSAMGYRHPGLQRERRLMRG
jgi:hypothetical protein